MRFSYLVLVMCAACGGDPSPEAPIAARSGEAIYRELCAMCHGEDGDGQGLVALDRPARSFLEGGFSFGNTREAIARTVGNGIAGSPMPGFASALSEQELDRVADYVISLGPEQVPDAGMASILTVGDTPRFVRGQLRAVVDGAPEIPRGLVVGTTDGLSWFYRADDLRLLAVRQGEFVDRTDWVGRGGTPLEPLGRLVDVLDRGDGPGPFRAADGAPLVARLLSTRTDGEAAVLGYELVATGVTGEETCEAAQRAAVSGYRRRLFLRGRADGMTISIGPTLEPDPVDSGDGTRWWRVTDGRVLGVRLVADHGRAVARPMPGDGGSRLAMSFDEELELELTTLLPASLSKSNWTALREELAR